MRWIIVSLLLFAMMFSTGVSYGKEDEKPDIGYALKRGGANVLSGWVELPRCVVYSSVEIPIVGLVFGGIQGSGYAVWRTILGMTDLGTIGLTGDKLYSEEFPDFVWQADWIPEKVGWPSE